MQGSETATAAAASGASPTRLNPRARAFVPSWDTPAPSFRAAAPADAGSVFGPQHTAALCRQREAARRTTPSASHGLSAEGAEEELLADEHEAPDEEEEEEEEAALTDRRWDLKPNRRLCPLDIRFSQFRARDAFRDSRPLDESADAVQVIPLAEDSGPGGAAGANATAAGDAGGASPEDASGVLLVTPFPPIEVLQWRCKLRDKKGKPLLDPNGGGELYDAEDRWFTLDNRRLYCLQKAAVAVWPRRALVDVVELPPGPLTRARQLKKFRTFDRGMSILIGGRHQEEEPSRWSWMKEVGLEVNGAEEPELKVEECRVQPRRRRRRDSQAEGRESKTAPAGSEAEGAAAETARPLMLTWGGILLFAALYLGLRFVAKVLQGFYLSYSAGAPP